MTIFDFRAHIILVFFLLGLCLYHDMQGLFKEIGIPCHTIERHLFIDSLIKSVKAVFYTIRTKFHLFHWHIPPISKKLR